MSRIKKLCVVVPHPPHGDAKVDLMWWLTAVEVQASTRRALKAMKPRMKDIGDRLVLDEYAGIVGTGWAAQRGQWEGAPPEMLEALSQTMLPDDWDVFCTSHGGRPIPVNRNEIVARFLRSVDHKEKRYVPTDYDALLMIDADVVPTHDALIHICRLLDNEECDIASGIYCMSTPDGPAPIIYKGMGRKGNRFAGDILTTEEMDLEVPDGAFPGGFLAVKRFVYEEMLQHDMVWFKDRWGDASFECWELKQALERIPAEADLRAELTRLIEGRISRDLENWGKIGCWDVGEDVWFCTRARELGFRLWTSKHLFHKHYKEQELRDLFAQQSSAVKMGWDSAVEAREHGYDDFYKWQAYRARLMAEAQDRGAMSKENEDGEEDDRRQPERVRQGEKGR